MKKIFIFIIILICSKAFLWANFAFEIGALVPNDTDAGIYWGYDWFKNIDEKINFGLMGNFFYRNTHSKRSVTYSVLNGTEYDTFKEKVDVNTITRYIPMMLGITLRLGDDTLSPFIGGGLGYGLGIESIFGNKSDVKQATNWFGGWNFQFSGGAMYELGSSSDIYGKVFYQVSNLRRIGDLDDKGPQNKKPDYRELDLTGYGIMFGIRMTY
jgi:opacity protein-like surface antigen